MADNVIKVNVTTTKPKSITVSGSKEQNYVTASGDTSLYNAQLSKNWAIGEGLVQNIDYSSKHYAGVAKENAEMTSSNLEVVQELVEGFGDTANTALENISNTEETSIANIITVKSESIANIEAQENETLALINDNKITAINDLNAKSKEFSDNLITVGQDERDKITTTATNAISSVEEVSQTVVSTVETSLQEYTEISEQIKADNSESSKLAREWAISETIVENIDYSAKYWAEKAKDNSGIYYDEVGEETIDVDILEAGYVTTGALEETIGDISSVLDDILGDV